MRRFVNAIAGAMLVGVLTVTGAVAVPSSNENDDSGDAVSEERELPGLDEGEAYMGWSLRAKEAMQSRTFAAPSAVPVPPGVQGIDVSKWQGNVDWPEIWEQGKRFSYVKATEGVAYKNPNFSQQYNGSYNVGMIRGSYHFGRPDINAGAKAQADYFVNNGGNWSPDGKTLPGVLDIEYNPVEDGDKCYDLSPRQMVQWVGDFVTRYKDHTGREAAIYTNLDWWRQCTSNSTAFNKTNSLWVARWSSSVGTLPGKWPHHTFWQFTDSPLDQDQFNGTLEQLRTYSKTVGSYTPKDGVCLPGSNPAAPEFCDVPGDYIFATEISWLVGQGITTGYEDGTFRPRTQISREAMAAFLYRYAGEPSFSPPRNSPFKDVPASAPFYTEITWLVDQGITTGYDDGTFRPQSKISREATAAFLYRFGSTSGYSPGKAKFDDVPAGYVFGAEIAWLADQGIATGYHDDTFRPRNKISREATAAFLYRLDQP